MKFFMFLSVFVCCLSNSLLGMHDPANKGGVRVYRFVEWLHRTLSCHSEHLGDQCVLEESQKRRILFAEQLRERRMLAYEFNKQLICTIEAERSQLLWQKEDRARDEMKVYEVDLCNALLKSKKLKIGWSDNKKLLSIAHLVL